MNLKTLSLSVDAAAHNCANQHVVLYRYVRQSSLIFESGFVLGMNASAIVLFLAPSLSLPIPQMRCINAQLPELARFPSSSTSLEAAACLSSSPCPFTRSLATSYKGTSSSRLLALDKLNWIMSAPLARRY